MFVCFFYTFKWVYIDGGEEAKPPRVTFHALSVGGYCPFSTF